MNNILYSIDIEKNSNEWIGILNQIINNNIPPLGSIKTVKEVVAPTYPELIKKMEQNYFFTKMNENIF